LFCGIGGFRLAFERAGCRCVFSSDWNKFSRQTYAANFGEEPHGDIHSISVADIPAHDILCAGFPCQPFSIAGVSKKLSLGRATGFDDKEKGNLFFSLAEIIEFHQPAAFMLENVKNLKSHDQGRTLQIIHNTLTDALSYHLRTAVIDALKKFRPATATADDLAFKGLVPRSPLFNEHLQAAKITKVDAQGRVVDFHSLRHTFCTNLHRAGVSQRESMELMRHNDPRLTTTTYTDTSLLSLRSAVQKSDFHPPQQPPLF
jgi:hypothetical protein